MTTPVSALPVVKVWRCCNKECPVGYELVSDENQDYEVGTREPCIYCVDGCVTVHEEAANAE